MQALIARIPLLVWLHIMCRPPAHFIVITLCCGAIIVVGLLLAGPPSHPKAEPRQVVRATEKVVRDPLGELRSLLQEGDIHTPNRLRFLHRLSKDEFASAFQLIAGMSPGTDREIFMRELFRIWALEDPRQAMHYAQGVEPLPVQAATEMDVFTEWSRQEPSASFDWLRQRTRESDSEQERLLLIRCFHEGKSDWSESDIMERLAQLPPGNASQALAYHLFYEEILPKERIKDINTPRAVAAVIDGVTRPIPAIQPSPSG